MKKQQENLPPWAKGPFELIRHANEHLGMAGDADRRISLIGFDNAIEVCIDAFLSLHPKARGGYEMPNDETAKAKKNYHTKLEFFYQFAKAKNILIEIPIAEIIWYHQLRSDLYHSGNGLVPEEHVIRGSRAAALLIFKSLFNIDTSSFLATETRATNILDDRLIENLLGEQLGDLRQESSKPRIDVELIRSTLRSNGHLLIMQNEDKPERFYRVCELPNSEYGIQVVEWDVVKKKWKEVGSFIRKSAKNLEQVKEYLRFAGGVEYQGELPQLINL